jgi:hypothetical protein
MSQNAGGDAQVVSVEVAADLSALQYHFVKKDSNGKLVACGANEAPLGILQDAPDNSTEKVGTVAIGGLSLLSISETVTFGQRLTSTAASKGEVVDAAGEETGARALNAGVSGDLIQVQLMFGKAQGPDA